MRSFAPSVAVLFYVSGLLRAGSTRWNDAETDIRIDPIGSGDDHSIYLVKEGKKFIVSCLYRSPESSDAHSVQWIREDGPPIETSISVITQAKYEYEVGEIKRSLIFPRIDKRDSGEYTCRVELRERGQFITKRIYVKVISSLEWRTKGHRVGGELGEPLIIDCGASGDPMPVIEITGESGQAVSDAIFKVTGSEATIPSLSKVHQDVRVKCVATQRLRVLDYTATTSDVHELTVDVWFAPEFEFADVELYAIEGKNVSLPCVVTSSSPPLEKLLFSNRDNNEFYNHERFVVTHQLDSQMAFLHISHVEDSDFGRYKCEAFNGKLRSSQAITLKKTRPPRQPRVVIDTITNTSVTWLVKEERDYGELPVLSYTIVYGPSKTDLPRNTPRSVGNNSTSIVRANRNEQNRVVRQKVATGLYHLAGLKPNAEYEFLFYARSEAGTGDPTLVKTVISPGSVAIVHSSANRTATFNLILVLLILFACQLIQLP